MDPQLSPDQWSAVLVALREGRKIEAIRIYRESTHLGLAESKEAVERIEASLAFAGAVPPPPSPGPGLSPADRARLVQILRRSGMIQGIKAYRDQFGGSLLASKQAIEALIAEERIELPDEFPAPEGGPTVPRFPPPSPPPFTGLIPAKRAAVLSALARGNKIEAIKLYREATGQGLAEAKSAVEAMNPREAVAPLASGAAPEGRTPLPHWDPREEKKKKAGCLGLVVLLGLAVAGLLGGR